MFHRLLSTVLRPPLQALVATWHFLWSPPGIILALVIWYWYDFPVPNPAWFLQFLPSSFQEVSQSHLVVMVCIACGTYLVFRLGRWWIHRPPRVVYVEKERVVYREAEQKTKRPPSIGSLIRQKYFRRVKLIEQLPLEDAEKESAKKRAKKSVFKDLEEHL